MENEFLNDLFEESPPLYDEAHVQVQEMRAGELSARRDEAGISLSSHSEAKEVEIDTLKLSRSGIDDGNRNLH